MTKRSHKKVTVGGKGFILTYSLGVAITDRKTWQARKVLVAGAGNWLVIESKWEVGIGRKAGKPTPSDPLPVVRHS